MWILWIQFSLRIGQNTTHVSGAAAVRVPRVPGHPLKFDNGCQAPVLREALVANKPHFLKNFYVYKLYPQSSFLFWKIGLNPRFFLSWAPFLWKPWSRPCCLYCRVHYEPQSPVITKWWKIPIHNPGPPVSSTLQFDEEKRLEKYYPWDFCLRHSLIILRKGCK